jgi:lipoprotein-anchoring transpeptidase ErfK/SrfK
LENTEVLNMSRHRHLRTSRILLMILGLAVLVGAVVFARRYRETRALAATPPTAAPVAAPHVATTDDPDPAAIVTRTPNSEPVRVAISAAPTASTKPAVAIRATTRPTTRPSAKPQAAVVAFSSSSLSEAKSKADAGKLLEARDLYNAALLSGKLSADDAKAVKHEMAVLNDTIVFSPKKYADDAWGGTFEVPPNGVLAKISKRFDVTPELLARINDISNPKRLRAGQKIKVLKGPMFAVVDKSDFTLDLYFGAPGGEGSMYVTTFRVGLGKDNSTPTGKRRVEAGKKLVNPTYYSARGEGVIEADDPKNPLGEFWIGLAGEDGLAVGKESYGIHGTIEPESIGTMASQGCIRMKNEDVARVYEMLVEGKSTVLVVD